MASFRERAQARLNGFVYGAEPLDEESGRCIYGRVLRYERDVADSPDNIFFLPLVTKIDRFALVQTPFDASEFARRRWSSEEARFSSELNPMRFDVLQMDRSRFG